MIEAHGLVKRFGSDHFAVDDVSFTVSPGEVYCLLGGRGAGRTTIVNLLLGALEPTRGRAFISGVDVHTSGRARRLATFVVSGGSLYGSMTARQNVALFARLGGAPDCRPRAVENAMRRMCIAERDFDRKARELRSGQSVLLWLAVAALRDTTAIVLDDPVLHADLRAIDEIQEGLQEFAQSGKAVLMTTSDMVFATRVATRVGILQLGRLVSQHSRAEMLDQSVTQLLSEFLDTPRALALTTE